jgi:hypothetical protein
MVGHPKVWASLNLGQAPDHGATFPTAPPNSQPPPSAGTAEHRKPDLKDNQQRKLDFRTHQPGRSSKEVLNNCAVNIGQTEVPSGIAIGEPLMIKTKQVQ